LSRGKNTCSSEGWRWQKEIAVERVPEGGGGVHDGSEGLKEWWPPVKKRGHDEENSTMLGKEEISRDTGKKRSLSQ